MPKLDVLLHYDKGKAEVIASLVPNTSNNIQTINDSYIQSLLQEQHFDSFFLLKDNIAELIQAAKHHKTIQIPIAEKRDAHVFIFTSEDKMRAYMSFTPAYGGKQSITPDMIQHALQTAQITAGIQNDIIQHALLTQHAEQLEIAVGKMPAAVKKCQFKCLLPFNYSLAPSIDENGIANFLDNSNYFSVKPGEALMERTVPPKQEDGFDVEGKIIKAPTVEVEPFSPCITGASVSADNENILVADIKGHPTVIHHGVSVHPVLTLPKVSLSTGNVQYDGSVYIKGDVATGLTVETTGDITIDGIVGAATLKSGGNIKVAYGIIGGGKASSTSTTGQSKAAHITATGNIVASFIDNADINCQSNVIANKYITHSQIQTEGKIIITNQEKSGSLIGGNSVAQQGIECDIIGNATNIKTSLRVGISKELKEEYNTLTHTIAKQDRILNETKIMLHSVEQLLPELSDKNKLKKLHHAKHSLEQKISDLMADINVIFQRQMELKSIIEQSAKAYIQANVKLHGNLSITLSGQAKEFSEDSIGGILTIENNKIQIKPIPISGKKA